MLRYNFKTIFAARGIEKPFTFLVKHGFSQNIAHRIINSNVDRLSIKYIEKICVYLRCTPNDFIEWVSDSTKFVDTEHPLNSLKRDKKTYKYKELIRELPLEKLEMLEELVKKLGKG